MKKMLFIFILFLALITSFHLTPVSSDKPTQDSEELRLQDMLMLMLPPGILCCRLLLPGAKGWQELTD